MKAEYNFGNNNVTIKKFLLMDEKMLYGKSKRQPDALANTVNIFSEYIGMEHGISKCRITKMKRGEYGYNHQVSKHLANNENIKKIGKAQEYKYLEILDGAGENN